MTHDQMDDADPDSIIVTIYRCDDGFTCGWYIAPLIFRDLYPMMWHTSPDDNILATVALLRAVELAKEISCGVCIVDPYGLSKSIL